MALITCPVGHYYDTDKVKECPVCKKLDSIPSDCFDLQSQVTVSGYKLGEVNGGVTELLSPKDANVSSFDVFDVENKYDAMADSESTIGFFEISGIGNFTAGWLVSVQGPDKGKSFTIETGRNICGSNASNDIVFSDKEILPAMHFSVVYEPKQNEFFLTPDKGAVFHNNEFLNKPVLLNCDDRIIVGSTELIFVPFCNKDRSWNE
ncbi:MAG: hypothetical protein IJ289_08200 [Clostridia bacterium]|nr:hypothetical protein [Clostridia bacterium]